MSIPFVEGLFSSFLCYSAHFYQAVAAVQKCLRGSFAPLATEGFSLRLISSRPTPLENRATRRVLTLLIDAEG